MAHCVVPEAEKILDKPFPVLTDGFVRLVDYLGGDRRIVQSARVSYGEGTKTQRKDQGLIDYLLRNDHTSPFEQVVLTYHSKMPIFVARQWVRHRTARLNEISGRYSILNNDYYIPFPEHISLQSSDNKQGRSEKPAGKELRERVTGWFDAERIRTYKAYQEMVDSGIARELARMVLPLNIYTEIYWQIDLHNLFHFIRLRLDRHAQLEIRKYAEILLVTAEKVAPLAVKAFKKHIQSGVRLSGGEADLVRTLLLENPAALDNDSKETQRLKKKLGIDE
ncbi:MAG: FAD-dependent thymidylate synthase [Spirochaetia bacterium]